MASYNGYVAELTKGGNAGITTLLSGVSSVMTVASAIPAKHFEHVSFAVVASDGVSGTFGAEIFGYVGGASIHVAGVTGIAAVGSYICGATTGLSGCPRPAFINFVSGKSNIDSGFTASVYMCGQY